MHRTGRFIASLVVCVSVIGIMSVASRAQDASLAQLPLLAQSNLSYLGWFALPASDGTGSPQGDFSFSGQALSVTPEGTLLIGGHTWYSTLCEVSIPAIGGTATTLQPCTDVTEGRISQVDDGSTEYGGSLAYGGRLIVSAYGYYDADGSQKLSHFAGSRTLGATGDVIGPVQVGSAPAGFVSGYMGLIPTEWQTAFGGPALTGNCCLSIISRTSSGPAVSVFNPDDVGRVSPVPATQVLGYPLDHTLAKGADASDLFTRGDQMGGVAFPSGTRSVLFIGKHGLGNFCYGEAAACGDAALQYKGEHAYPYVHQVWAYDANDLLAVKNGSKQPYDVQPYAIWRLPEINNAGSATINSAFFDQKTSRFYITEAYGGQPRVHVYQITGGSGGSSVGPTPSTPAAPTEPTTPTEPTQPTTPTTPTTPTAPVEPTTPTTPTTPTVEIPGAPTGLSLQRSGQTVSLSWNAPGGSSVTAYLVEYGEWWTQKAAAPVQVNGGATSTNIGDLSRGGLYYFRVRAINPAGTGEPSNVVGTTIGRYGR
jgi:hypothetical protein